MKSILCVGFGGMGCRHVQAFLKDEGISKIYVVENNPTTIETNIARIGAQKESFIFYSSLDKFAHNVDFAIIATSAQPRFDIVKILLKKGIKYFLLEKVVFQSKNQFGEIINLLEKNDGIALGNFVSRYFEHYLELKSILSKGQVFHMVVYGGDFGLACNALHYIDLFEYFTGDNAQLINANLKENPSGNKRGNEYKEIYGEISMKSSNHSTLTIISDIDSNCGVIINIETETRKFIIDETTLKKYTISKSGLLESSIISLKFTSSLTNIIYEDLLKNRIILPTLQETQNAHIQLFNAINPILGLEVNDLCPIT